ncbi:sigma-Y antisigma factor component [Cytobacillus spongiae]|jgi:hypothetical protein|uniref:sigma-Y antisigma factor component n=1 Tax=Cytobacillus spongiae TaxID=2901381 RepID=UPI001F279CF7|nr:sigma-Y antisigma factor component [Cytobacillus spongiae]UII56842.1 sigma-Y antisigma factor component [Cytobacillus spongiae]
MNEEISLPLLIVVAIILICQSIFLFMDARKHGHNYWFWGIIALIQAPMPTIVYLIFVRKIWQNKDHLE